MFKNKLKTIIIDTVFNISLGEMWKTFYKSKIDFFVENFDNSTDIF